MKHATHAWMIGLIACATLGGAACNRTAEQDTAQTQAPATQSAAPRGDTAITTAVQAKYYTDDAVRARHIDVSTDNGVVTLRGTVESEAARQQAVNLAQSVEGVSRVENELKVGADPAMTAAAERPAERTQEPAAEDEPATTGTAGRDAEGRVQPAWITTKIQAQYFVSPEIKPWNVDVTTTSGGVVTLQGEVETAEDKTEAVRIARATEGVTSVEDRLRVKGEPAEPAEPAAAPAGAGEPRAEEGLTQPDAWLTAKIQSKYFLDNEVKGHEINVDTHDGVVTLKGTVESEAQRRQAVALARNTDGVKSVNDQLQIHAAAEPGATEAPGKTASPGTMIPPVLPVVDDTWITTKIQSKYFLDEDVKGHQINVDTQKGVVTLKGNVETEEQKREAEQIARETEGVSKVVNNLVVGRR